METDGIHVRVATEDDAAHVRAIYAPIVRDTCISFELAPPAVDEMAARIRTTLESLPWIVAARRGDVLGYAYASPYRHRAAYGWSVEVSVYVHADARRRGIARALYESLFAVLRLQGFVRAYAGVALPNDASEAMHVALGFEPVGVYRSAGFKHGGWHDVAWWQRGLSAGGDDPTPPTALPGLLGQPALEAALAEGLVHVKHG